MVMKMSNKKMNRQHRINDCVLMLIGVLVTVLSFLYMKTEPEVALLEAALLSSLFYGGITSIFLGIYFAIKDFSLKY